MPGTLSIRERGRGKLSHEGVVADYTIGNQRVTDPEVLRALEKLGESADGDTDFSETELGQLLDVHDPTSRHIDEQDRRLHGEQADPLTESEFSALAREYRQHFPQGNRTIDTRLFQEAPVMGTVESPPEVGWVQLAEPIEIDVEELSEHIPLSGYEDVGEIGQQVTAIDGRTILWFQPAAEGGFDRVYSPLPPNELAGWLASLPEEERTEIFQLLDLPAIDEVVLSDFQEARREAIADWDFLESHLQFPQRAPARIEYVAGPPQELARNISQRAYGITDADSETPVIGTSGLGPCIAVTFYHEGVAALAHVDSMTDTDSLRDMLDEMGVEPGNPDVEVRLIGGEPSSRSLAIRILRSLQELGLEPIQVDIIDKAHPSQLAIDARSGEVYYGYAPFVAAAEPS